MNRGAATGLAAIGVRSEEEVDVAHHSHLVAQRKAVPGKGADGVCARRRAQQQLGAGRELGVADDLHASGMGSSLARAASATSRSAAPR